MENKLLEAALKYRDMGLSVIPVNPTTDERFEKKPFIKWEKHQTERATPEQIKEWWKKWPAAMIGVVTGEISGFFAVDSDTEEADKQLEGLIPDNLITPSAKTPHGKHILFAYHPGIRNYNENNGKIKFHVRGEGGYLIFHPSMRENGLKYEWQVSPFDCPFAPAPSPLLHALKNININNACIGDEASAKEGYFKRLHLTSTDFKMFTQGRRDEDLFHVVNCFIKGGGKPEEAYQVLNILAQKCDPPFPEKEISVKIQSAIQRAERREINFAQEVREFVVTSNGFFLTSDVFNRLQVTSRQEKKNVVLSLLRLQKEGLIERAGSKAGSYRIVDREITRIDLKAPKDVHLDLKWPLEVEDLAYINPKSIVVIAGETDAGKSAFCIDFTGRNKEKYKIHFMTTEMAGEMPQRLSLYGKPMEFWEGVDFIDRETEFEDIVSQYPDDCHVIDYLSAPIDKIWSIKEPIDKIFFKLRKGIALVSLQMGRGQSLPYGKSWGIERSRLAITLKRVDNTNVAEIIKAKNWVNPKVRPTGLKAQYWCVDGCKIQKKGEWQ